LLPSRASGNVSRTLYLVEKADRLLIGLGGSGVLE
jgi:hypothetical protein